MKETRCSHLLVGLLTVFCKLITEGCASEQNDGNSFDEPKLFIEPVRIRVAGKPKGVYTINASAFVSGEKWWFIAARPSQGTLHFVDTQRLGVKAESEMYVDLKTPTTYWLVSGIGHTANPEMKNRRAAEIQFSVSGEWLKTVFSHFKQRNKPVSIDIDANIYVNMYCLGESEKKTGNAKVKTKFIFSE